MNPKEETQRLSDPFHIYPAQVIRVDEAVRLKVMVHLGFGTGKSHKINLRGIRLSSEDEHFRESARGFVRNALMKSLEPEGTVNEEQMHPLGFKDDDVWLSEEGTFGRLGMVVIRVYPDEKTKHLGIGYDECGADVWYLKDETDPMEILRKGRMLNQELLNAGLAVKVE